MRKTGAWKVKGTCLKAGSKPGMNSQMDLMFLDPQAMLLPLSTRR